MIKRKLKSIAEALKIFMQRNDIIQSCFRKTIYMVYVYVCTGVMCVGYSQRDEE